MEMERRRGRMAGPPERNRPEEMERERRRGRMAGTPERNRPEAMEMQPERNRPEEMEMQPERNRPTEAPDVPRLSPGEIAYHDFARAPDGVDEGEVRAFLGEVADAVAAARERELRL